MKIKTILTPVSELLVLSPKSTAKEAVKIIDENGFLSLPVVDGTDFNGFLSKQFVYEEFFKQDALSFDDFMNKPVSEFLKMKVDVVDESLLIEDAANIFFNEKVRFLPVNKEGKFIGILTQKALFKVLTKVYGLKDPKIVLYTDDFKGTLAKITEVISKNGGNITNIVHTDAEVMGLQEINIRLKTDDVKSIVKKLDERGFKVNQVIE